jgi:hypothetical protein
MFMTPPTASQADILVGTADYPARMQIDLSDPIWVNGFQ